MPHVPRCLASTYSGVAILAVWCLAVPAAYAGRGAELTLRSSPGVGLAPLRVSVTAQLLGVDDNEEEYYCPTVEWDWGDGSLSRHSPDCEPFAGTDGAIRRSFFNAHVYRSAGDFTMQLRLQKRGRTVVSGAARVTVVSVGPQARKQHRPETHMASGPGRRLPMLPFLRAAGGGWALAPIVPAPAEWNHGRLHLGAWG